MLSDDGEVITQPGAVGVRAASDPRRHRRTLVEHMRVRDLVYRRALAISDGVAALLVLVVVAGELGATRLHWPAVLAPLGVVAMSKVAGLYDHDAKALRRSTIDEVPALFTVSALFAIVVWLAGDVLVAGELTRLQVLGIWSGTLGGTLLGRSITRTTIRRTWANERCMLLGSREAWERLRQSMSLRQGLELVDYFPMRSRAGGRFLPLGGALKDAEPRLREVVERDGIHRVIIAINGTDEFDENMLDGIFALEQIGLKVSVVPHMLEVVGSAGELEDFDGLPVLGIRSFGLTRSSRAIKRVFDLSIASVLLVCLSPVMLVAALAVRRSSPGPVLYRQRRIGYQGTEFEMLKFRSMVDGADKMQAALADLNETEGMFKVGDDPRITPVGRLLRRTSLDELPQLLNVMKGTMSLVGPRPLVPTEDREVQGWRRRRLELAPGMTGPWQVLSSTRVPLNEMVKMDYLYIANWSPWADVKALVQTLPHVLGRRGL